MQSHSRLVELTLPLILSRLSWAWGRTTGSQAILLQLAGWKFSVLTVKLSEKKNKCEKSPFGSSAEEHANENCLSSLLSSSCESKLHEPVAKDTMHRHHTAAQLF